MHIRLSSLLRANNWSNIGHNPSESGNPHGRGLSGQRSDRGPPGVSRPPLARTTRVVASGEAGLVSSGPVVDCHDRHDDSIVASRSAAARQEPSYRIGAGAIAVGLPRPTGAGRCKRSTTLLRSTVLYDTMMCRLNQRRRCIVSLDGQYRPLPRASGSLGQSLHSRRAPDASACAHEVRRDGAVAHDSVPERESYQP